MISVLISLDKAWRQRFRRTGPRQWMERDARRPGGWPFIGEGGEDLGCRLLQTLGPPSEPITFAPLWPTYHLSALAGRDI